MKRVLLLGGIFLLMNGCNKSSNKELTDRIAKLEQRIEVLEKLATAPAAKPQPTAQAEQSAAYQLPIGKSYVKGNPNAPITITKFSDYQCPFCNRAQESFVDKLFEDPELKGKVKVVFKHFPLSFHKNARSASKAALAAGEQGHDCFWEMTKKLYSGQRELSEENYKKWAKDIKCKGANGKEVAFDGKKFWSDYTSKDADYEKMIKEDMELGMTTANVRGTPTFFVNGWKLPGRSVEAVKQIVKEKQLVAGGLNNKGGLGG